MLNRSIDCTPHEDTQRLDFFLLYQLGNKTALCAALKNEFLIIFFFTLHSMKLIKKYELIFFKMMQSYKKIKKLLASNTNEEVMQYKE